MSDTQQFINGAWTGAPWCIAIQWKHHYALAKASCRRHRQATGIEKPMDSSF